MGTWGPGLYQDDAAKDLKNTIGLLSNVPISGDRIVEILLSHRSDPAELDRDGGPTFWLVIADQFERRGIKSAQPFELALAAIESGADLRDLAARDMTPVDLRTRGKVLAELAARLRSPRPERPRPKSAKPPALVVEIGDAYCFPTMQDKAINPWARSRQEVVFEPDGWGAMLVLGHGRAYNWLPWCAYASLSVPHSREPTLEDVRHSRLLIEDTAQLAVPRRQHLSRLEARYLGRLGLNLAAVAAHVPFKPQGFGPEFAVYAGWSFYVRGCSKLFQGGVPVSQLIASERVAG